MSSAEVQERDNHLLALGAQCSHDSCSLVDFLPFTCGHCKLRFCQDHFKVDAHSCAVYDESKHNRVAPNCPLCNSPIAIPPGQDPNIRMDAHLRNDCSVMTGKVSKKSGPICARDRCGKVLFAPISCTQCRQQFCPSHRFPSDHTCREPPRATGSAQKLAPAATNLKASAGALGVKAKAAKSTVGEKIEKGVAVTKANVPKMPSTATPVKIPYSKQDRRARAERDSRRKALKERGKKGLLSDREKAILAEEEAEYAAASGSKKDCLVM